MNRSILLIFLIFSFWDSFSQSKIESVIYSNDEYFLYPESQDEKYMNWSNISWYLIRDKYKLKRKGESNGKWVQFYENNDSIPAKIFELKNGNLNGQYRQYYENGQLELIENYLDEKITGLGVNYYKCGKLRDSVKFRLDTARNGYVFSNKTFMKSYYENGKPKKIENYDSLGVKNGIWSDFYDNGQIKIEQYFTNKNTNLDNAANKNSYGKRTKTLSYYYPNGQLRFTLNYSNDKIENGLFIEYYPSGNKKISGNLSNELRSGNWTEFYESGIIKSSGQFSSGSYTVCGVVPFTAYYEFKIGEWNYYYPNNKVKANGVYEYGSKNIENTCESGANLKCGNLTNEWNFYNSNGELVTLEYAIENELILKEEVFRKRVYDIE
jgi:antitoxin component YwqK of YwqJK toxin-antitoxin module